MRLIVKRLAMAVAIATSVIVAVHAAPAPKGKTILLVSGIIANKNVEGGAAFDMAMLEALPKARIKTSTPWTQGVQDFEGVPLKAVLDAAGASGSTVRAVALNDHGFEFPVADADTYKVLVAYAQNGKAMPVREKGPLWIIYPLDDVKDIQNNAYHSRIGLAGEGNPGQMT